MKALNLIDAISRWTGMIASFSLLFMALIVTYEVASRYLLNAPTIWAWDVNVQLMLLLIMLGLAETYRRDAHVRVDVIVGMFSARTRAWIDVAFAPMFFLIAGVIVWAAWAYFSKSYARGQTASTLFAPPLWPVKFSIVLGGGVLFLQGIAKFARDLALAITGTPLSDMKE
jgi:TRAP-type mannitol/chloroaromatic compound transport system permease small subunit